MQLSRYWPMRDEVNRCIKAEAESASDAVLLAVHQPMPLVTRQEGTLTETPASEHELLDAFLTEDLPQGTLIMPITGASGVGKSHMIRWLAAQLERDPRAKKMHVIRIPKSASLRDVVRRILAPLGGDDKFVDVRDSMDQAIAGVSPQEAAVFLSGGLKIALGNLAKRLRSELRENSQRPERRAHQDRLYHAENLPNYFNDAVLAEHFSNNVLAPIIKRAVGGRTAPDNNDSEDRDDEERLPQFSADDLIVPQRLERALGTSAQSVQRYYAVGLNGRDGAGREIAAAVLNEVVDQAVRQVFGLNQAVGGVTLESIIQRIRELLFKSGRELVLLVEDFAALSGIQEVLLNVSIQQAVEKGRQFQATMRTALAVTDGYLVGRDTIATRAEKEWVIKSELGDKTEVQQRTINLMGAYINAARWGEEQLERMFSASSRENEVDLTAWVETFDDSGTTPEEADLLQAFGSSSSGPNDQPHFPLFPFNRAAILMLIERHLSEGGQLHFKPRRIINNMLRKVLLMRADFEQGGFPPPGFQDAVASAGVASWLASVAERERLIGLVVYWGGNPVGPEQAASMAPQLFRTFQLPTPEELGQVPPAPATESATPEATQAQTEQTEQTENGASLARTVMPNPQVALWDERLTLWAGGTKLGQQDANKLRGVILRALEKTIPWNRLRMTKRKLSLLLTIPNASGNSAPAVHRLAIADDHTDPTGQLRLALLAAIRFDLANSRWDYPEADEDSARLANLVERLTAELIPLLEQERDQEVRVLAWTLARQARLLGFVSRQRMSPVDALVRAVTQPGGAPGTDDGAPRNDETRWEKLRREAMNLRPTMRRDLLERIGCFQGGGNTLFALDPTLLEWADSEDQPDPSKLPASQKEHFRQLTANRLPVVTRPLIDRLRKLSAKITDVLGADFDKQRLVEALKGLIDTLDGVGVWPDDFDRPALRKEIETFRNTSLKAQLDEAGPLLDADSGPDPAADETLERLGHLDFAVIDRSEAFLNQIERFIQAAERAMDVKEKAGVGINPAVDAEALQREFDQIHRDLCIINGEAAS